MQVVAELFDQAVLENERRDAPLLEPLCRVRRFDVERQRYERATRSDDDAGTSPLRRARKVGRQRRRHDVEDHGADRSVVASAFLAVPALGAGRDAGPNVQYLLPVREGRGDSDTYSI